jgi:hypothetical protein
MTPKIFSRLFLVESSGKFSAMTIRDCTSHQGLVLGWLSADAVSISGTPEPLPCSELITDLQLFFVPLSEWLRPSHSPAVVADNLMKPRNSKLFHDTAWLPLICCKN